MDIELDDKVLINKNILIKKNKKNNLVVTEKNKVKLKNQIYNILGEVVRIHNPGIYDILINKNYEDYNLKVNDICRISSDLFKVIFKEIWEILKNTN